VATFRWRQIGLLDPTSHLIIRNAWFQIQKLRLTIQKGSVEFNPHDIEMNHLDIRNNF
jgi:hypothetical protein